MNPLPASVRIVDHLASELGPVVAEVGAAPVVVSEQVLVEMDVMSDVAQILEAEVLTVPGGEPVLAAVAELARVLRENAGDVVVAVGGGSVIDTVKLAARLVADPDGLPARLLGAAPFPPGLGVVAVPTTAGSGAEVTRTAIVAHDARKTWAWDDCLRPERAVLAPDLSLTLPRPITVASGLDAFVHAIEAATGRRATPAITELGLDAVRVIHDQLPRVVSHPGDRPARTAMLRAATAAGVAIDHCGTGVGHAVGHALGSLGAIPHGLAVMLGWRAALDWALREEAAAYAHLAEVLSPGPGLRGLPEAIDDFLDQVGFAEELDRWARPAVEELAHELQSPEHQPMCLNNARPVRAGDHALVARLTMEYWER